MPCPPIENALRQMDLPILDLKNRMGHSDYIDFLQPEELTHPIMRGIDAYRRPFVAFKVYVAGPKDKDNYEIVGTFFQRYSDDTDAWAFGTTFNGNQEIYHDSRVRLDSYEDLEKRLKLLIAGETINNTDYSSPLNYIIGNGGLKIKLAPLAPLAPLVGKA
jgi:hypothetical protein